MKWSRRMIDFLIIQRGEVVTILPREACLPPTFNSKPLDFAIGGEAGLIKVV
jgi:hypothetical protein